MDNKNEKKIIILIYLIMILEGCKTKMDTNSIKIDPSKIAGFYETFSSKKIFLGHASVGYNIVAGIENIFRDNNNQIINIIEVKEGFNINKNGFYHKMNGKNFFPKSKCDAFRDFLTENNMGNNFDIAFFKFCYVDFDENTDVQAILNYYVVTLDSIKKNFPDLTIFHVTTPLTAHAWGLKAFIKNIIKGDIANVKRNDFNQLLRKRYRDKEPIFDLAKIESTLPDNNRSSFSYEGETYYSLYNGYTDDGGHLNELGSFVAAMELVQILADIAGTPK